MKVAVIIPVFVFLLSTEAHAQGRHKKTVKYLLEQIALFRTHDGFVTKGNGIARDGLGKIAGNKQEAYRQDKWFFESQGKVSLRVRQYRKSAALPVIYIRVLKIISEAKKYAAASGILKAHEKKYAASVMADLLKLCERDTEMFSDVITAGGMEMTDDARLQEIDKLYSSAIDQQSFLQSFFAALKTLSVQRVAESKEMNSLKIINGIK